MCGIVALVGERAEPARLTAMTEAVRHRGPDDLGTWFAPGVALGHRRLSILDLSPAGHQPMASHDGRYQLIFNGELFNFHEVASALPGVQWRSRSDSEVVLEAFAEWGPACLERFVGMYALAIWDCEARRLFCARDRLGIKPLYIARLGTGWAIASEIGALLAAGVPAAPDDATIYDFLARDFYEHADGTFFRGITKLPPAHWMWLAEGETPAPVRYWDLAAESARITVSADRAERGDELIARMQESVRLSLFSDVPVGIALSGGLDSAALLALVDRVQPDASKIEAFSFDFDDARYSERPWVEAMAAHTGHRTSFCSMTTDDFVAGADSLVRQQQEPHAGAPIIAYSRLFETIRSHGVIVVMDGSGLDESLAGYDRFRPALWADLRARGDDARLAAELAAEGVDPSRAAEQMAAAASEHGDIGTGQDLTSSVRPDCLHDRLARTAPPLPAFERPFPDALRNLMYRELRYTKLPRALRFRDRLSMAVGCELRPPFLDHRLLAYAMALPAEDRISGGVTKALLRDAAARLLPEAVRTASKRSVQTPQREWFRGSLAAWVREQLDRASFWDRGWVDRTRALAAMDRFIAGHGDNSFFLWQWIDLDRWASTYLP